MDFPIYSIEQVAEIITSDDTFDDFAVRGDDVIPADGHYRNSRFHGDECGEFEMPGVSAIDIPGVDYLADAVESAAKYGHTVVLLRGYEINANEEYNDPGECLMQDSTIVCVIRR